MLFMKKLTSRLITVLKGRRLLNQLLFFGFLLVLVWYAWHRFTDEPDAVPKHLRRYLWYQEGYAIPSVILTDEKLDDLLQIVQTTNQNPDVRNFKKHGPVTENTTVIAIQVHQDVERLQHLIISLAQVKFIQQVLLVFSHSYYDEDLNKLIRSINFCKVMQIYYPYSLQLYPDHFPGVDPRDGFNRDARRTEHKQHWWWKANYIFSFNKTSPKRVVIFLEEDDYVLPDMLYMLRHLQRLQLYFPFTLMMTLGKPYSEGVDYDAVLLDTWSAKYERGLAFNITAWKRIVANATYFCKYNDCSWSYSLAHLFGSYSKRRSVDAMTCSAPRVLSTSRFASGGAAGRWARALVRRADLFPSALRAVVMVVGARRRVPHAAPPHVQGGWGDHRDQKLCLDVVKTNISHLTFSHYEYD